MSNLISNNGWKPTQMKTSFQQKQNYTIAIANQKGGVAKTTTTISLGGALVNYNQEVLLVDLDPQANLTLALGLDPKKTKRSVSDVFVQDLPLTNLIRETAIPGLFLLPSNNTMGLVERHYANRPNYENVLKTSIDLMINSIRNTFDYIILDCPPSIGIVTLNALVAAQLLIVPTQPEYFSINALRSMMNTIREVREKHNPNLVYRILITMLDKRNRIHRTLSEQILNTFQQGLLHTIIETDTKLRESTLFGLPITYYKSKTRSAVQYSALAQELIEYVSEKTTSTV